MNLAFSERWPQRMPAHIAGQPTHFIEKIWQGAFDSKLVEKIDYIEYLEAYKSKFQKPWDDPSPEPIKPKLHTIRHDPGRRWRPGMLIHPIVNSRSANRFQFMPTMVCTGVQEIKIEWLNGWFFVTVDGNMLDLPGKARLAFNDGFSSIESLKNWFDRDFSGVIVHWTNLRY